MNQFVAVVTNAVMTLHHMFCRIFIEVVIQCLAPVSGMFSFQQRQQWNSVHIFGNFHACQFQEGRSVVNVLYHFCNISFGTQSFGKMHNQRSMHRLFIHEPFVKPSVFAHIETLVGSINHQCIIHHPFFFQIIQHTSHVVIQWFHHLQVVTDISLEFPFCQVFSFEVPLVEILCNGFVKVFKLFAFFRIHPVQHIFVAFFQTRFFSVFQQLQVVCQVHILQDTHFLSCSSRTSFIVIIERFRKRESLVFIKR